MLLAQHWGESFTPIDDSTELSSSSKAKSFNSIISTLFSIYLFSVSLDMALRVDFLLFSIASDLVSSGKSWLEHLVFFACNLF